MAGCGEGEVSLTNQNKARFAPTPSLQADRRIGLPQKGYEHAGPEKIL